MAFDAFIHIDQVEGESTDTEFTGQIEVLSFNNGVSQQASGTFSSSGGRTAERADWTPFTIVKAVDKASPLLMQFCAAGTHVDTVEFTVCRAGTEKVKYLTYTMKNCIIASVNNGGSSGEDFPSETVTIMYGKINVAYVPQGRTDGSGQGQVAAGWDVEAGQKM